MTPSRARTICTSGPDADSELDLHSVYGTFGCSVASALVPSAFESYGFTTTRTLVPQRCVASIPVVVSVARADVHRHTREAMNVLIFGDAMYKKLYPMAVTVGQFEAVHSGAFAPPPLPRRPADAPTVASFCSLAVWTRWCAESGPL